jgi:hypothetical protein
MGMDCGDGTFGGTCAYSSLLTFDIWLYYGFATSSQMAIGMLQARYSFRPWERADMSEGTDWKYHGTSIPCIDIVPPS